MTLPSRLQEGVLLARLWNLQTSLMDTDLTSMQQEAHAWKEEAERLSDKVST